MVRLEVDTVYAVRPHKGERRYKGRLLKTSIFYGASLEQAKADVPAEKPGYCRHVAWRAYDDDAFRRDPLSAKPDWTS